MFSIQAWGYIIAEKLMSHRKTLVGLGIDLLTNIYVDIIENMVKYFNTHRCEIGFDSLFLILIVK